MIGEFFSWYFGALVDFWGTALRLGLPQIVLLVLILMWLRRARCRKCGDKRGDKSGGKSCCWTWSSGWGERGGRCCCCRVECGCTCGRCCCQGGGSCDAGADAEAEAEPEVEVVAESEVEVEAEVVTEADDS